MLYRLKVPRTRHLLQTLVERKLDQGAKYLPLTNFSM
jgi:hypothetical protein